MNFFPPGLKHKRGISGKFGLYDGSQFVYSEGSWTALNLASLFWRYGFSLLKVNTLIGEMLNQFERYCMNQCLVSSAYLNFDPN